MGSGGLIVVDEDTCMVDFASFSYNLSKMSPVANVSPVASAPSECWIYWNI